MRPPERVSITLRDGYAAHARLWPAARSRGPGTDGPAGVLYFHGIQSHGGWYEWSASVLADCGLPVLMPDRRGSGRNRKSRGDVGSTQQWLDDVADCAAYLRSACGVRRFGLAGVSWGGKLALRRALDAPDETVGVLLLAPGVFPRVDLASSERFRVGLNLLRGGGRLFEVPLSDPELFTDNPAGQAFIADDRLKLTHVTARFLYQSRLLDRWLVRRPSGVLRTPTHLLLGGRDRIIRNRPTAALLRRLSDNCATIMEIPDAAHTLEFEADRRPLEHALRAWAGRLLRSPGGPATVAGEH